MKKIYESVELEVIRFTAEDVITASGDWTNGGNTPNLNDPNDPINWT